MLKAATLATPATSDVNESFMWKDRRAPQLLEWKAGARTKE